MGGGGCIRRRPGGPNPGFCAGLRCCWPEWLIGFEDVEGDGSVLMLSVRLKDAWEPATEAMLRFVFVVDEAR